MMKIKEGFILREVAENFPKILLNPTFYQSLSYFSKYIKWPNSKFYFPFNFI